MALAWPWHVGGINRWWLRSWLPSSTVPCLGVPELTRPFNLGSPSQRRWHSPHCLVFTCVRCARLASWSHSWYWPLVMCVTMARSRLSLQQQFYAIATAHGSQW